ncbi:lipoprotein-releasing ABC transporter permease subunit [Sessilibacter sp. MAH4]
MASGGNSTSSTSLAWFVGRRFGSVKSVNQLVSFISRISMIGLVVGVAMLVVVVAVMNGFDRDLRTKILAIVPQASLFHRQGLENWSEQIEYLKSLPSAEDIQAMAPFVHLEGMLKFGTGVEPVLIYGVEPKLEVNVSDIALYLQQGDLASLENTPNGLALGSGLAKKLGLKLGDSISFIVPKVNQSRQAAGIKQLTLVALLDSGTELDHKIGVISLSDASELAPIPGTVTGIRLKLNDLFDAPWVVREVATDLPYGFYTSDWTRTHGNLYHAVKMSSNLVSVLLVLIIGIAVFNVVSTLVLAVVEKQGDIAILRTLGATPNEILKIFMVQGCSIGVYGTVFGVIIGVLLTILAPFLLNFIEWATATEVLRSDIYPVSELPIDNRISNIVFIAVTALILSLIASIYPAWRASRIQPAEALRYD